MSVSVCSLQLALPLTLRPVVERFVIVVYLRAGLLLCWGRGQTWHFGNRKYEAPYCAGTLTDSFGEHITEEWMKVLENFVQLYFDSTSLFETVTYTHALTSHRVLNLKKKNPVSKK